MSEPRSVSSILRALVLEEGRTSNSSSPSDSPDVGAHLAFVGNWHDPCPRLLLLDPRLESVDIVIWQIIRIHAQAGKLVAFPTYRDLMQWARVSRATVARAVTVLRLARWLPLCASVRDAQGRFRANVYALQDEPLPLAETLRLDEHYVRFADQARTHRHAHVRKIAEEISTAIREAATSDARDLGATDLSRHIAIRFQRMMTLFERDVSSPVPRDPMVHRVATRVQNLNSVIEQRRLGDPVQDLNAAARVQNLNSVSSSKKFKTTTTTPKVQMPSAHQGRSTRRTPSIRFPAELALTDSQQRVLALRLERLPDATRQDVLDEAAARILAKRRTSDPVRSEFDYVARLASSALAGAFTFTDAGQRLRERREGRAAAERRLEQARAHSERQRQKEVASYEARELNTEPRASSGYSVTRCEKD